MNILVVDDEPQFRMLVESFLRIEGHSVLSAENGAKGLEQMAAKKVDLIISDVYMPEMDGITFHKTVREIVGYEKLPFLFVSAFDDEHTLHAVKDPTCEGFLKKGRPVAALKEWIQYLLAPEHLRPATPPSGRTDDRRMGSRGSSNVPII